MSQLEALEESGSSSLYHLLKQFRDLHVSHRAHGDMFEQLMVDYLTTDPTYKQQFSDVWMWMDWPGRNNKGDTGIDIVAKDYKGGYCAIQCKFYAASHTIQKSDIDSFFTASGKEPFTSRIIISTTDKWGSNAAAALSDQQVPVARIGLADLEQSRVRWDLLRPVQGVKPKLELAARNAIRPHQQLALDAVFAGFKTYDRGKLIMACGTGKTFTSLKIAERLVLEKQSPVQVLFLAPSISLVNQTLKEWTAQCAVSMRSFAVCSDSKVGRTVEDIGASDLAFPATTDSTKLAAQIRDSDAEVDLTVVFSTYQSIDTVANAQKNGLEDFDLIICDEAHRTTGLTLANEDASCFVKVHSDENIRAKRRLYMTATPRLYDDSAKSTANEKSAVLASMDDESVYGPEFHRLGFGKAVEDGLLSDYRVLILAVDEKYLNKSLQSQVADANNEITLDDAIKIVGCWNGLAKRSGQTADDSGFEPGAAPMTKAVAFASRIKDSQKITRLFNEVVQQHDEADESVLRCEVRHVDGTQNALKRREQLEWLKAGSDPNECRILSNARCLSEGVDVPALDAVLFLSPRNSPVDVVQSVGRVMRRAEGKQYGYIILPVGIPSDQAPEKALADNTRYKVVWQILQALRAHDDRFNATVNKIELNKKKPSNIMVGVVGFQDHGDPFASTNNPSGNKEHDKDDPFPASGTSAAPGTSAASGAVGMASDTAVAVQGTFDQLIDQWRNAIYAKIVSKVGERTYWESWAKDIAAIAQRHVDRINLLIEDPTSDKAEAFSEFLAELRCNINPGISPTNAIDMLAQHLITKPVFDALFEGYEFSAHNPVAQTMQKMLDFLDDQALEKETVTLESFYESVRTRAQKIDNHEGRQRVITELYEKFFKTALPKVSESLGIVYTPLAIVDFMLQSTDHALATHFGSSLSDEGVHILDPFTGTGTFIVRLLQSGLIKPQDLLRKYTSELHANEIVLLAYYIAAINIEAAMHDLRSADRYHPFNGIVLTDTFQLAEHNDPFNAVMFPENNDRVKRQMALDIRVIIGNPPYSVGQGSENDNNKNLSYPNLDTRIESTYAARSGAINKRNLYDSYIRAFRWASDRIGNRGIVCFVTNGAFIDAGSADGFRKSIAEEFSAVYCLNLRGNQRTSGETSRREGGKIFGAGSRTPIAVTLLVKIPGHTGPAAISYHDIGDYLSREEKLAKVGAFERTNGVEWTAITPNSSGDWINQRSELFSTFAPLGDKESRGKGAVFQTYSLGVLTARDAWAYNFSRGVLLANMAVTIEVYNEQRAAFHERASTSQEVSTPEAVDRFIDTDPTKISWTRGLKGDFRKNKPAVMEPTRAVPSAYRPFCRQWLYFDRQWNEMVYRIPSLFPTPDHPNRVIAISGIGTGNGYSAQITDSIPCFDLAGAGNRVQCFPRYGYSEKSGRDSLFDSEGDRFERHDAISAETLDAYRARFGAQVSADDVFYYTYGILHSPEYRSRFAAELGKMIPRLPMVDAFVEFSEAGRQLAELHVGYETVDPWPLDGLPGPDADPTHFRVEKLRFEGGGRTPDKSKLIINSHIRLSGIPEQAYRYEVNGKSAIEWIMDRYQVKVEKNSGIRNDPNQWSDDPRYIVDLIARIVTVSVRSTEIVESLPGLGL